MANKDNHIGSVATTFRILETVKEKEATGVTEIANALDVPKSTVFSHLNTLTEEGYLAVEDGQYSLSLRFLDLGHRSRSNSDLYTVGTPKIDDLAEETGELVNLMAEEDGEGIYLYIELGENAVKFDTYPGLRSPLYCIALGKAILAHMSEERREEYIRTTELVPVSENTITDPEVLREELDRIRDRGYALDRQERSQGIRCVAAPITDGERCLGALSVSGPVVRMQEERFTSELPDQVIQKASEIELNLRYP